MSQTKTTLEIIDTLLGILASARDTLAPRHEERPLQCAPASPPAVRTPKPKCLGGADSGARRVRLYIYLGSARGLAAMATQLRRLGFQAVDGAGAGMSAYVVKCGTTVEPDIEKRLAEIGNDSYAAVTKIDGKIVFEPGFTAWVAQSIATSRETRDPDIIVMARAIAVDLPLTMTPRAFDHALRQALASRSLHAKNIPGFPKRFTAYDIGGTTRVSKATELVVLSPRNPADGDWLVSLVETILRDHRRGQK